MTPRKKSRILFLCTFVAMLSIAAACLADSIKERMLSRLPAIVSLKKQGIVGENNLGYLEYRTANKAMGDVVAAENKDRQSIYKAIAEREKTTVEVVGKTRAAQIALKADPGEWLQDPNGKWYQK